jgi:hypothetical protein
MAVQEEAVGGIGELIAQGVSEPMFRVRIQPGKYKYPNRKRLKSGKIQMGKRQFVPSPTFPDGIILSFPAWFVATVGLAVLIYAIGGVEKIISGVKPSDEENEALNQLLLSAANPWVAGAKALGLF